jgi:hypothetical protein
MLIRCSWELNVANPLRDVLNKMLEKIPLVPAAPKRKKFKLDDLPMRYVAALIFGGASIGTSLDHAVAGDDAYLGNSVALAIILFGIGFLLLNPWDDN